MNSEIRRVMSTASNSSLKQSCSVLTSVTTALEVIFNVMRSINPRFTYLLTYLLTYLQGGHMQLNVDNDGRGSRRPADTWQTDNWVPDC